MNSKLSNQENKIQDLKRKLQVLEYFDQNFSLSSNKKISQELRELRERVLYVHFVIETLLEWGTIKKVCEWEKRKMNTVKRALDMSRMSLIFSGMNFNNKVRVAVDLGVIRDEKLVRSVSNYRDWFSHPTKFKNKLKGFEDRKKYLEILETLDKAYFSVFENYLTK